MEDFAISIRTLRERLERRCFTFKLCELARQLCGSIPSDMEPVCRQTLSKLADPKYVFSGAVTEKMLQGKLRKQAVNEVANEDWLLHQAYLLATNSSPEAQRLIREKYAQFNNLPHDTGFSKASLQECIADLDAALSRTQAATRWERLKQWQGTIGLLSPGLQFLRWS
jgi:hypothetical protein